MKSRNVGIYPNMASVEGRSIDLSLLCNFIKNERWADTIKTTPKEELPCFTVGGVFKGAKSQDNLAQPSNIASLDIDNLGQNLDEVMGVLTKIRPHIYSYFRSRSLNGLCVLVAIDDFDSVDDYKEIYEALFSEVSDLAKIVKFDYLPNLNRLRYVSSDPDLYLNIEAIPFTKRLTPPTKIEVKVDNKLVSVSLDLNKLTGADRVNKVAESYTHFTGAFGANGKPRHDWVLGLARWMCRADVDQYDALSFIQTNYHNGDRGAVWEREVARCVRDSYRTYAVERGTHIPDKPFDYRDINTATDLEQVRDNFLTFIGKEEEYVEGLGDDNKSKVFLKSKISFLKTIYRWL